MPLQSNHAVFTGQIGRIDLFRLPLWVACGSGDATDGQLVKLTSCSNSLQNYRLQSVGGLASWRNPLQPPTDHQTDLSGGAAVGHENPAADGQLLQKPPAATTWRALGHGKSEKRKNAALPC